MKEGWEYKKLGEVCEILDSLRKPVTKKDRTAGIYPYYGASGIQDYVDSYIFDGRFLLVGEDGAKWGASDKSAFIIEGKSWVNNHAHILKVSDKIIDILIEYYLTYKDLSDYITGAVVPKLTQKSLLSIPIPVPPLTEQERIVSELDLLSSIIEKQKAQLKELDTLAQSIFYDMFGDPIENPKGWEVKKLGEVVDITSSLIDPNQEPYCNQYHVSPANILSGTGEIIGCNLAKDDMLISGKYAFEKGMILYSKIRPNLNKVAIASFNGICSADMYPLSIKGKANNVFICRLLLGKHFLEYAIKESGRARMPKINRESLFAYTFPIPPLSLQQSFASKIEAIEAQKALITKSMEETRRLFDSRMDYWFA